MSPSYWTCHLPPLISVKQSTRSEEITGVVVEFIVITILLSKTMASKQESKNPWIFSAENLKNSPSFRNGVKNEKELHYRQQAANFIQDMGQKLQVSQLCINTGIVYMHRFYMVHSFNKHHRYMIAPACIFLAAKVEEQPKKLEHVLKVCHSCLNPGKPDLDTSTQTYLKQSQDLIRNELTVLEAINFDISVDHPHTYVVKCTQLVKASREFAQMAYFMATNSLHLTPFGVLYGPTVVAAMCIYLSCKWSNYEIPLSSDGKPFWEYMDPTITEDLLTDITAQFIKILSKYPTRLNKLRNYRPNLSDGGSGDNGGRISESSSNRAGRRPPPSIAAAAAAAVPAPAAGSSREENESRTMTTTSASHQSVKAETPKKPSLSLDEYSKRKMHHPQMMTGNGGQKHHGEKNPAVPTLTIKTEQHGRSHDYRTHHSSEGRQQQPHPRLHHDASLRQPTDNTASPAAAVDKMDKHQREYYLHKQRQQQQRKSNSGANPEHHHHSEKNRGMKEIRNFDSKMMNEMYRREPERLRKYLKHQLPQTRELTPEESAFLHKLEQKEEARRKLKRSSASSAAGQQVPMHTPSLKIKLGPNPSSTHDASSRLMSGNTSGSFQQAPRKRTYENSAEVSAKYAKRAEDQSKMGKQHHGQMAMNPAHRSSHYNKHSSSAKHSLEASENRKAPHKSEKFQQSNYNANARTNGGSTSSSITTTTSSAYATLYDRPPSFDNEVPEDLFEPEQS